MINGSQNPESLFIKYSSIRVYVHIDFLLMDSSKTEMIKVSHITHGGVTAEETLSPGSRPPGCVSLQQLASGWNSH